MGELDETQPDARAAIDELVARHGLSLDYPDAVEREVATLLREPGLDDPRLDDLTALPFVTIDNEGSRDLDQALCIERRPGGTEAAYDVHYALADASHFVTPGSALFDEAVRRGASYYLPGLAVPMLPRPLSEDLISLNPHVVRRAMVFTMTLDAHAMPLATRLTRARIHSQAKLSYTQVQALYDAPQESALREAPFAESLALLREVGELRVAAELARDVVQFNRTELHIALDAGDGGASFTVEQRLRLEVERYNEQISLLCNALGARLLLEHADARHIHPIFRTHPPPVEVRVARMRELVSAIVARNGLDPQLWCWRHEGDRAETLADYLARLPSQPAALGVRAAIERQILFTNQASSFSPFAAPHHALGLREYARFSAPMREVVGIFTHKEALELLGRVEPHADTLDDALREAVIEAAHRARALQRRLDKDAYHLALDALLGRELRRAPHQRTVHRALILGARQSRLYVQVDDPPLELKIYTDHLEDAFDTRYVLDEAGVALEPQGAGPVLAVGATIGVRVASREGHSGRWRFDIFTD